MFQLAELLIKQSTDRQLSWQRSLTATEVNFFSLVIMFEKVGVVLYLRTKQLCIHGIRHSGVTLQRALHYGLFVD